MNLSALFSILLGLFIVTKRNQVWSIYILNISGRVFGVYLLIHPPIRLFTAHYCWLFLSIFPILWLCPGTHNDLSWEKEELCSHKQHVTRPVFTLWFYTCPHHCLLLTGLVSTAGLFSNQCYSVFPGIYYVQNSFSSFGVLLLSMFL